MNILIVDDDALDRQLIKRSVISATTSHTIDETDCAQKAFAMLESRAFDIILVDYRMPKMNGLEFVVQLKGLPLSAHTAIVVVSNVTTDDIITEAINAGAQDFLLKEEVTSSRLSRVMLQATKRFELEKQLFESYIHAKQLAESDNLTGLLNRHHFEDCLKQSILDSDRKGKVVAVFLIDLDHFKKINDSFGHEMGDKLLKVVADRIGKKLRLGEKFARLGGDEFALVIEDIDNIHQIEPVAARLLSAFNLPFFIDGREMHCSASVGIALCPVNANKVDELLKYADIAMYRAKSEGRNKYCLFEDNMQREFFRKYSIERSLRKALKQDNFTLHFQPLLDTNNRQLLGAEALIRWPDPDINSFPDEFIPIAEESYIIIELGRWVIQYAIERLALFRKQLMNDMYMSVNLSSVQLGDAGLCQFIKDCLLQHGLAPSNLMLEITETALLTDETSYTNVITELHNLGCRIALDDFGTGYSSIAHLLEFPIDVVKLHKSLIDGSALNQRHATIMKGLCNMLNDLNTAIIAEGIEDAQQLTLCEQCNVTIVQGYYFSKPLPQSEFLAFATRE